MDTNSSSSTSLVIGLAAFGLALVVAGVRLYRRNRAGGAAGGPQDDVQVEAGIGNEEQSPGAELRDDQETHKKMPSNASQKNLPLNYFLLLLALSIPFYLFGGSKLPLPMNLPVSALMGFMPLIAASILSYGQHGLNGIKELLQKAFDYKKIKNKLWYVPILLLSPMIYFLSYVVMRLMGLPLPDPNISILLTMVFFFVFFIEAVFEELGWMGYAIDPMQNRWGALRASIILGFVWQIWHLIPDIQAHNTANWILWHDLQGVALRILMVWIYNNTGRSVFSAILVHAVDNVSWSLFPNFGSGYDPFFTAVITWLVAGLVIFGWGTKTLARYRYASVSQ